MIGYVSSWYMTIIDWVTIKVLDLSFFVIFPVFSLCFFHVDSACGDSSPPLCSGKNKFQTHHFITAFLAFVFHPERCSPEVWHHCCNYSFVPAWNGPQRGLIVSPLDKAHSLSLILSGLTLAASSVTHLAVWLKDPQNQIISWNFYSFCSRNSPTDKGTPPDRGEKKEKKDIKVTSFLAGESIEQLRMGMGGVCARQDNTPEWHSVIEISIKEVTSGVIVEVLFEFCVCVWETEKTECGKKEWIFLRICHSSR